MFCTLAGMLAALTLVLPHTRSGQGIFALLGALPLLTFGLDSDSFSHKLFPHRHSAIDCIKHQP